MVFDFDTYLATLDPSQTYEVQKLTGGVVNITVRAIKNGSHTPSGRFQSHRSIILKHAPPYVAAVGEQALMDQSRQVTEAQTLAFFNRDACLAHIKDESSVSVPELLHHDPENHVIVMSDLGRLPNLSDIFDELGGYTPDNASRPRVQPLPSTASDLSPDHLSYYTACGRRLGLFFAHLHSRKTLGVVSASEEFDEAVFNNPSMKESVHEYAIKALEPHLDKFSGVIPLPETPESLFRRMEEDWLRPTPIEEQSFILGDCWTGAILVSPPSPSHLSVHSHQTASECDDRGSVRADQISIGAIDFEFASITRGPHGDIPQLLAHLELFLHAARFHQSTSYKRALETLITALVQSYKVRTQDLDGDKLCVRSPSDTDISGDPRPHGKACPIQRSKSALPPDPFSIRARMIRSAILALASEILNCAFWKVWPCHSRNCAGYGPSTPSSIETASTNAEAPVNNTNSKTAPGQSHSPSFNPHVKDAKDDNGGKHAEVVVLTGERATLKTKRRTSFQTYAPSSPSSSSSRPTSAARSLSSSSMGSAGCSLLKELLVTPELDEIKRQRPDVIEDIVDPLEQLSVHHPDVVHLCPLVQSMAQSAIWLAWHAGKDTHALCEPRNWQSLTSGPPGWFENQDQGENITRRKWILDLFLPM